MAPSPKEQPLFFIDRTGSDNLQPEEEQRNSTFNQYSLAADLQVEEPVGDLDPVDPPRKETEKVPSKERKHSALQDKTAAQVKKVEETKKDAKHVNDSDHGKETVNLHHKAVEHDSIVRAKNSLKRKKVQIGSNEDEKNSVMSDEQAPTEESEQVPEDEKLQGAWNDPDDERKSVNLFGRQRTKKLRQSIGEREVSGQQYAQRIREYYTTGIGHIANAPGGWAELPSQKEQREKELQLAESSVDKPKVKPATVDDLGLSENVKSLLQTSAKILDDRALVRASQQGGTGKLQSGTLDIRRVTNANEEDPNQAEARCVQFHNSGKLILTAGLDRMLRIFQVDGERNAKVQGIRINRFPIHSAKFTGGGEQVVITGRHRFFYQFDMKSGIVSTIRTLVTHEERSWENFEVSADGSRLAFVGQRGKILILSNTTKRVLGQIRLNSRVVAVAFAPAGEREHLLYAAGTEGIVYLCDTKRFICVDRHRDEGAIHSTCIAVSSKYYALGSDSGVVNVYPASAMGARSEEVLLGMRTGSPEKAFMNLTTPINVIAFSPDGKLIAFSSHDTKNAIRIAHIPSMTVYSNWPSIKSNIRRVCSIAFSPGGGYIAIGNDKGDVQMMRLPVYPAN